MQCSVAMSDTKVYLPCFISFSPRQVTTGIELPCLDYDSVRQLRLTMIMSLKIQSTKSVTHTL